MNFTKRSIFKKMDQLSSDKSLWQSKITLFIFKYALIIIIAAIVTAIGLFLGFVSGIIKSTPKISSNSIHAKNYITTIYDKDNEPLKTLSTNDSNRIYVPLAKIPANLQNAVITVEDKDYYSHKGINVSKLMPSFLLGMGNTSKSSLNQTITQQLVENNILGIRQKNSAIARLERTIKEYSLSIEVENITTKQKILEEYLNTINFGEGTLGVQTAAKKYFNKDVSKLNISECAVLATIITDPSKYNPLVHPENNASKRLQLLKNMFNQHYITKDEYSEAVNDDIYTRIKVIENKSSTGLKSDSYFEDALIKQVVSDMKQRLGYDDTTAYSAIFSGGLKIYSTQDSTIQNIVTKEANDTKNYPSKTKVALTYALSVRTKNKTEHTYSQTHVLDYMKKKKLGTSLVFSNKKAARKIIKKFRSSVIEKKSIILSEKISLPVQPQTAITIIDQKTGQIEAMIGGRGSRQNNIALNRATDFSRQPGSIFKVLAAFLPGLDTEALTLATAYDDAPYRYTDNNKPVKNYYTGYRGYTTIRTAIANSMNVIAAKAISDITPEISFDYLKYLGFTTLVSNKVSPDGQRYTDMNQRLALGQLTNGIKNVELTSAFAAIADQGVYHRPIYYTKVVDQNGNIILQNSSRGKRIMKTTSSSLLTDAMKDSFLKGASKNYALSSSMTAAGQDGTSDHQNNYWLAGYTPHHTCAIWLGYDTKSSFQSINAHKKIWKNVMDKIISSKKEKETSFRQSSSLVKADICTKSGKLAIQGICDKDPRGSMIKTELFARGTAPAQTCDQHVQVTLCTASSLPASSKCPSSLLVKKIYMARTKNSKWKTADTPFLLPAKYERDTCPIHQ